jgi:hypothetical protein
MQRLTAVAARFIENADTIRNQSVTLTVKRAFTRFTGFSGEQTID